MPKRVAVIDVSHWHSTYDAAYLSILRISDATSSEFQTVRSGSPGSGPSASAARRSPTIVG